MEFGIFHEFLTTQSGSQQEAFCYHQVSLSPSVWWMKLFLLKRL